MAGVGGVCRFRFQHQSRYNSAHLHKNLEKQFIAILNFPHGLNAATSKKLPVRGLLLTDSGNHVAFKTKFHLK